MPAEKYAPLNLLPKSFYGAAQSLLVGGGAAARRRAFRLQLSKRQVAAEHNKSGLTKRSGHSNHQR